jgi:hypothetical protein
MRAQLAAVPQSVRSLSVEAEQRLPDIAGGIAVALARLPRTVIIDTRGVTIGRAPTRSSTCSPDAVTAEQRRRPHNHAIGWCAEVEMWPRRPHGRL